MKICYELRKESLPQGKILTQQTRCSFSLDGGLVALESAFNAAFSRNFGVWKTCTLAYIPKWKQKCKSFPCMQFLTESGLYVYTLCIHSTLVGGFKTCKNATTRLDWKQSRGCSYLSQLA